MDRPLPVLIVLACAGFDATRALPGPVPLPAAVAGEASGGTAREAALPLWPLRRLLAPREDRIEEVPRVPGPAPLRQAGVGAG